MEAVLCWFWQDWLCRLAGNSKKAHTIPQSICTHYSCFESMGRIVALKKCRSKIWVTKSRVQKTGSFLYKKRRGYGRIVGADWLGNWVSLFGITSWSTKSILPKSTQNCFHNLIFLTSWQFRQIKKFQFFWVKITYFSEKYSRPEPSYFCHLFYSW